MFFTWCYYSCIVEGRETQKPLSFIIMCREEMLKILEMLNFKLKHILFYFVCLFFLISVFVILNLFWFLKLIWIVNRWGLNFCFISRVWTLNLVNLIKFTSTVFVLYFLFLINNKSFEKSSTKIKDLKWKTIYYFLSKTIVFSGWMTPCL